MKIKKCVKMTKATPVGSAQYTSGEVAVFSEETAAALVKQGFAIYWDAKAGKSVDKPDAADPLQPGADQARREAAKDAGARKLPERK